MNKTATNPVEHESDADAWHVLGIDEFARMLGVAATDMPDPCRDLINLLDFRYRIAQGPERDAILLSALTTLERRLEVSGPQRIDRWEEGWGENLEAYRKSGFDREALIPGYYRRGVTPMRLFGNYVIPADRWFEVSVLKVLQAWIACTFLDSADHVCEIGCGPAHNLLAFASLYPEKTYFGMDWAKASQSIIEEIARHESVAISGRNFDMFNPDESVNLPKGAAVMTIGAMEQLGRQFGPFLDYLLSLEAAFYLHIEPIVELHDREDLMGYLGIQYMQHRGYLDGYLKALRALEKSGAIQISHCRKLIGSVNYDGWNLIVWRKNSARGSR